MSKILRLLTCVSILLSCLIGAATSASAASYVPVSGAGSTWSQNAIDQWRRNVVQYGMTINYQGTGSSDGRNQFKNGTVDFGISEIPYGLKDSGSVDQPPTRKYAYMPIVAGGTSFMYNLKIGGKRLTNLKLSGDNLTKIFTGVLKTWNDPAIQADNPGIVLPARRITPVVRSDGSGTSAQFTLWMSKTHQSLWDAYCAKAGLPTPCGLTSTFPVLAGSGFTAQSGSLGVSGFVAQDQNEGSITYVEYSYALNSNFPVAKVLNSAGYFVGPDANNTAVALLGAKINDDPTSSAYLTQDLSGVYTNPDKRAYPISSYSYMIIPTAVESNFSEAKGRTLGAFAYYFLCQGQQQAPVLGYSPLPINLVKAGLDQVKKIPGVDVQSIDITKCDNPTFSADGSNTLAAKAPQPSECDKQGAAANCVPGASSNSAAGTKTSTKTTNVPKSGAVAPTSLGASAKPGELSGNNGASPPSGSAPTVSGPADNSTTDPASVSTDPAVAVAATLPLNSPGVSQTGLTFLAVIVLLAVVIVPPLLLRRFTGGSR